MLDKGRERCYSAVREKGALPVEHLAEDMTQYFLTHDYITADQTDWCRYAILHRGMNLLSFALMSAVGAVVAGWPASLVFTFCFRFLRVRTGGYHAKTPSGCLLVSTCIQLLGLTIARQLQNPFLLLATAALSAAVIVKTAPANNAALHLTPAELAALCPMIRTRVLLVLAAGGALWACEPLLGGCVAVSLAAVAAALLLWAKGFGAQ